MFLLTGVVELEVVFLEVGMAEIALVLDQLRPWTMMGQLRAYLGVYIDHHIVSLSVRHTVCAVLKDCRVASSDSNKPPAFWRTRQLVGATWKGARTTCTFVSQDEP